MNEAMLISRSCTLGWFEDALYGELWLHPVGLIRLRLGLSHTVSLSGIASYQMWTGNEITSSTAGAPPAIDARAFNLGQIAHASPKNRVIDFRHVSHVALRNGILADRLNVHLNNGFRHKFLWLRADIGYWKLREELGRRLGGRLILA